MINIALNSRTVVWTALEAEGLGCNLQHYNPLMDVRLQTEFNVPETWALKSQLVFGKPTGQPGEKKFEPVEERVKYFGL
jgi:predicted oxidoreductase (fatty acid repression mutant protein)